MRYVEYFSMALSLLYANSQLWILNPLLSPGGGAGAATG